MKQKDLVTIIVVVAISAVLSLVVSSQFISSPKKRVTKVEVVQPITADFPEPNKKYFNEKSVNPTQLITIGNNANQTPFNGPKQ